MNWLVYVLTYWIIQTKGTKIYHAGLKSIAEVLRFLRILLKEIIQIFDLDLLESV